MLYKAVLHLLFSTVMQRLHARVLQQILSYKVSVRSRCDGLCGILVRVLGRLLSRVPLVMVNGMALAVVVTSVVL